MRTIWVPGQGEVDFDVFSVDRAVREYDDTLLFKRNLDTGDWCVYKYMGGRNPDYPEFLPVLAFRGDSPPLPSDVIERLQRTDALRRGDEIRQDINRHNEKLRKEKEYAADDAATEVVESLESMMHRQGVTFHHRSLPKKDPKQQNKGW